MSRQVLATNSDDKDDVHFDEDEKEEEVQTCVPINLEFFDPNDEVFEKVSAFQKSKPKLLSSYELEMMKKLALNSDNFYDDKSVSSAVRFSVTILIVVFSL